MKSSLAHISTRGASLYRHKPTGAAAAVVVAGTAATDEAVAPKENEEAGDDATDAMRVFVVLYKTLIINYYY